MATTDSVGFQNQLDQAWKGLTVQRNRLPFFKAHCDLLGLHNDLVLPERNAHDGVDDFYTAVQLLQVFGFVGCAEHVGVGRIGFLRAHLVAKTGFRHKRRHLSPATEFVDEKLIEPGLVDFQVRVGEQAVAVKTLNVVALEGAAIAPDIDVVFLHRGHQHGARHRAAQRRGVEVGHASRGDMERSGLQRRNALGGKLVAAVDQAGFFSAIFHRLARNFVVIRFVRLAQVGGVGVRNCALEFHPVQGSAGIQPA